MNQIATVDYDKIKYRLYERNGSLVLSLQLIRQEYDEFNNVIDKTVDFYVVKEPRNIREILSSLANSSKRVSFQERDLVTNDRDGNQLVVKNYELLQKRRELKYFSNKLEKKIEKAKLKKKAKNVKLHDKKDRILKVKQIARDAATALGVFFTIGGAVAATKSNSNNFPFFPKQMQERRVDEEPAINKKKYVSLKKSFSESADLDYEHGTIVASSDLENASDEPSMEKEKDLVVKASEQFGQVIPGLEDDSTDSNQITETEKVEEEKEEQKQELSTQTDESTIDSNQNLTTQIEETTEQVNEEMKATGEQENSLEQMEEIQFDVSKEETDESLKESLATDEDIKSIEAASQEEVENIINQAPTTEVQASEPVVMLNDDEITEIAKQMLDSNATPEQIEHVATALVNGENLNATPQYGVNYIEKYNLTPEQIDIIKATVRQEAGPDPRENYAVMSTIIRRCESGIWGGTNPYDVITADGQFTAYLKGHYLKYANGNYPECTDEIVDAMLTGQLEPFHDKESFSSGSGATGEQYTSTGNRYR